MGEESIKSSNPWWENPSAIDGDQHICQIIGKPYYFNNPIKRCIALKLDRRYILRGCRQVGKTTLLKEKISEAIKEKIISHKNCLFLSCEMFKSYERLQEVLFHWIEERKAEHLLICLDEITFVEEWQRSILWLINSGLLINATVVITGSNARDLKKMGERFPGRHVGEINLYPLSIQELKTLEFLKNTPLSDLLQLYMKIGGFPHAIADYCNFNFVTDETYETYANWIFGDAHRFNLSRETLTHILFRVFDSASSQVTWQRLIEKTPIKRHETAFSYVEHLDLAFLCRILNCYEPQKDMAAPRKAKKIYFIDPLLYVVAGGYLRGIRSCYNWWKKVLSEDDLKGKVFESTVVNHYARGDGRLYYWYSSNLKREVDMLIQKGTSIELYEIKLAQQEIRPAMGQKVNLITPTRFINSIEMGDDIKV